MKIAINLLSYVRYQGIEVYTVNLIAALAKNFPEDQFVLIKNPFSPAFFNISAPNVSEYIVPVPAPRKHLLAIAQQLEIGRAMKKTGADVLFCTSPAAPFFLKNKVVTIHDCAYDRFPEFANLPSKLYFKAMFYAAKYFSRGVITVSGFSRKELIDLYGFSPERVHAVYSALPELPSVSESVERATLEKFGLHRGGYFLYVGNTRPRKNILGLLKAYALFAKSEAYQLVLVGKTDTRFLNIAAEIKKLGIMRGVVQTGFVSDEEKAALYRGSAALAFPSFYEGFGFPVLEAQSLGVPVITSNTSSLPEIGGSGALYVDPYRPEDIAAAMEKIAADGHVREELVHEGCENVKRFSWDRAAQETMAVLRGAGKNNPS